MGMMALLPLERFRFHPRLVNVVFVLVIGVAVVHSAPVQRYPPPHRLFPLLSPSFQEPQSHSKQPQLSSQPEPQSLNNLNLVRLPWRLQRRLEQQRRRRLLHRNNKTTKLSVFQKKHNQNQNQTQQPYPIRRGTVLWIMRQHRYRNQQLSQQQEQNPMTTTQDQGLDPKLVNALQKKFGRSSTTRSLHRSDPHAYYSHHQLQRKKSPLPLPMPMSYFNHNMVGMTNPCLKSLPVFEARNWSTSTRRNPLSTADVVTAAPATTTKSSMMNRVFNQEEDDSIHENWWPETAWYPHFRNNIRRSGSSNDENVVEDLRYYHSPSLQQQPKKNRKQDRKTWRVVRLRRRQIGSSYACYQRVRDAALQWEFHSNSGNSNSGNRGRNGKASSSQSFISSSSGIVCLRDDKYENDKMDNKYEVPVSLSPSSSSSSTSFTTRCGYRRRHHYHHQQENTLYRQRTHLSENEEGSRNYLLSPNSNSSLQQQQQRNVQQIWSGPGRRRLITYTSYATDPQSSSSSTSSKLLSKIVPSLRIFALSPVAVVYDVVDQITPFHGGTSLYTCTAFATMQGHWLRGEERVTVLLRSNGNVDVEILSFSQPGAFNHDICGTVMGKLVWPLVIKKKGGMQQRFFEHQMQALERVAHCSSNVVLPSSSSLHNTEKKHKHLEKVHGT